MTDPLNSNSSSLRRKLVLAPLAAAAATLGTLSPALLAQTAAKPAPKAGPQEDIVLGGSIPITGVFAFAGIAIDLGIKDYLTILNESGGIKGRIHAGGVWPGGGLLRSHRCGRHRRGVEASGTRA